MFPNQIGHLITNPQLQTYHGVRLLKLIKPRKQHIPADIRWHRQANSASDFVTALGQRHLAIIKCFQGLPRVRQVALAIIG
ncbi:hypothetical protein SAMN05216185_11612 [Pseudomonas guariconensis]|nr:hypothetical protein SAMN05216185_11612 [Pseudomonas guariconensis]